MPVCRTIVGLEFDRRDDMTACLTFGRDVEAGRAWTEGAPQGRARSLYDVVTFGGTRRLSTLALATKALRHGSLIADRNALMRGAA